jgi:hypothetical protein
MVVLVVVLVRVVTAQLVVMALLEPQVLTVVLSAVPVVPVVAVVLVVLAVLAVLQDKKPLTVQ